jgi:glycosyltransferase involved in cell wall biosynthesis
MAHRLESPSFDATLRTILAETQFDVVQIEGIELARSIPLVRTHQPQTAILFDDHNAEAELQRRAFLADVGNPGRWAAAAYSLVQTRRLQRFEAWACRAADAVTVVSEADRRQLARLVPELEATVIPNCIDVSQYGMPADPAAPSYDLVFTGKMDYRPNVDAVLWFAEAIWPEIVRERPETTWAIVGKQPHRRLASLKGLPGIMVTGRVESVEPYLEGATVCVMPFRIGSGTRLKLIEAMASKKAIVSTTVGAEGFPVVDGKELILADDAHTFAAKVLELLAHPAKREQLGQTARQLALQYDWRNVVTRFEAVYDRIVGANLPK